MAQVREILVVDDNAANLQLLVSALEDNFTVRAAINGQLALQSARQQPPDLVLLDLMMPEMNGYEVCEAIKSDPTLQHIPVIFISGISDQIDKAAARDAGAVDFLVKPLDLKVLFKVIDTHLG